MTASPSASISRYGMRSRAEIVTAAKAGKLADGLVAAVARSGRLLAIHFPPAAGDKDELPNRLVQL